MFESQPTETVESGAVGGASVQLLAPGSTLGERYEIRGVLGRGGSAIVYRAYDRELRREVALKILRADRFSAASLARLRREAGVARDAASERLVRIFDIGNAAGTVFLTLEAVDGGSLDRRLADGPLPVEEALRIARQALEGLQILHALRIVHRDVKPGNLLLTAAGDVKLADFGLARHLEGDETRHTRQDAVVGTPQYLAPEQLLGGEADARSDLYSLGVVLFEMLTGKLPYEGRSALGAVLGHLRPRRPDLRALRPEVSRWLAAVVHRLLAREPGERYATAAEVLADLAARRAPRGLLRRPARRAAALAVLLLAVGVAIFVVRDRGPRLSYFSQFEGAVHAMSDDGQELWSIPASSLPKVTLARLQPGGRQQVAALLGPSHDLEQGHLLSLIDPASGRTQRRVRLPSAHWEFPGFSPTFSGDLEARDLDGDGGDEILAVYYHQPWWPCYVVLYEPRIERARVVFVASGHHRIYANEDLDGDGRDELLIGGINNRMGWATGLAAVRLVPPVNQPASLNYPASTPDRATPSSDRSLLWYALTPRARLAEGSPLGLDARAGTITLTYFEAPPHVMGLGGFPAGSRSALSPTARHLARKRAYTQLRDVQRLLDVGQLESAPQLAKQACNLAEQIQDPLLADWARRIHARSLVASGRRQEGEAVYTQLILTSPAGADIAYDAGKALHLAGQPARAAAWFQRGIRAGEPDTIGRGKWEFLEGIVLALSEQGRHGEALRTIDQFLAAYPDLEDFGNAYRSFLRWRMGLHPTSKLPELNRTSPDLLRYWRLEFRWLSGAAPALLLREIRQLIEDTSESDPQLFSLQAEILARLGRLPEALAVSREGFERGRQQGRTNTGVRTHLPLIAERAARIARAAGEPGAAREIEAALAAWRKGA